MSEAPVTDPATPEKGVADILKDAWELYRRHARALLITCAVLFVPASIVKSCAMAVITGPTIAAETAANATAELQKNDLANAQRALQDAYASHVDKATLEKLQADQRRVLAEMERRNLMAARAAMGSFTVMILGVLGTLVTAFFLYGLVIPVTNGALTMMAADRILGGSAGWREVWQLLFHRLGPLMAALIPAAVLVAFGYVVFRIPGIILGLLFAFLAPVVLIEGLSGRAAFQRSAALVSSDWLRVALMIAVLAVLRFIASAVAGLLVPSTALFAESLVGDLLTMVLLPVPILGLVLLYFDIRRRHEGFTDARLRADLDALKAA